MRGRNIDRQEIPAMLEDILNRGNFPSKKALKDSLTAGINALYNEPAEVRPASDRGGSGSLVRLSHGGYFIIIPDLHGRMDFFSAVMNWSGFSGRSVLADMADGLAQVVCVGDAFHSEVRGRERWQKAMKEWLAGFGQHKHMDLEMRENLGLLEMLAIVKSTLPRQFHFLKGNHENIGNEEGEGNFPFRKFVFEGEMVKQWVETFLGKEILRLIRVWEKSLPLMAEGPGFLVSHCEPGRALTRNEVINAYDTDDVIYNLTWTDNGSAEPGSVISTLYNFGITSEEGRIFGGHRPVSGRYSLRQDGRYIQINTPNKWVIAAFTDMKLFKPDRDIVCLKDNSLF